MKRKVVKHGPATFIISLPSKWIKKFNISKGDQLNVSEEGKSLLITTERGKKGGKVEVDITDLDRTSIIFLMRALYKEGYDEIALIFNNQSTVHYRLDKEITIMSLIYDEVNKLPGMEVIQQRPNRCVLKALSEMSYSEFDPLLRRIFLLMIDMCNDLIKGIENADQELLATIEQKHLTITKFINFCKRILKKHGLPDYNRSASMARLITGLKRILDVFKHTGRYAIALKPKPKKELINIMRDVETEFLFFYQLFYKFRNIKVLKISEIRDKITKSIIKNYSKLSKEEIIVLTQFSLAADLIASSMQSRIALEH
tara:strand:- start:643 stop:1584 length:942 start_codon:yes stop_codon:yes gene_type:complete